VPTGDLAVSDSVGGLVRKPPYRVSAPSRTGFKVLAASLRDGQATSSNFAHTFHCFQLLGAGRWSIRPDRISGRCVMAAA